VCSAIATLGPEAAPLIQKLIAILERPGIQSSEQISILEIFWELGPTAREAVPAIRGLFKNATASDEPDEGISEASACALLRIYGKPDPTAFHWILNDLEILVKTDRKELHADRILQTLRRLGESASAAEPRLYQLLEMKHAYDSWPADDEIQKLAAALVAISSDKTAPLKLLINSLTWSFDDEFAESVLREHTESAIPVLIDRLKELMDDESQSIAILEFLEQAGKKANASCEQVLEMTQDKRPAIRIAAAKTLGALRRPRDRIVQRLICLLDDQRPLVREQAALSLAEFGSDAKSAIERLRRLRNDEYIDVREAVAKALEKINE
jgi:HEAT repeat protein